MSSRPTLATLLRERSRSARVGFVAALYAARGETTRVEGDVVCVGDERYLVASRWSDVAAVLDPRESPRKSGVDHVVAVDPARTARLEARYDAHVVSASDLDRLARYGLDHETADELYREQFGRSFDTVAPPAPDVSDHDTHSAPDTSRSGPLHHAPTIRLAVVSVLALLVIGVAFSGAGATMGVVALPWEWDASETVSVSTPAAPTAPSDDAATATDTAPPSKVAHSWVGPNASFSDTDAFAPGVSSEGITDVSALAEAHAATLGNRSYRWELEYVEMVDGTVTARGTETVRVGSRRSFVSQVDWRGRPVGFTPVASRPSYADGTVRHHPTADDAGVATYSLTDLSPAGEQGWRASRYVRWYLSTANSSVERTLIHTERPTAVVEATGTTYPNAENYTVRAHVTSDGFVQSLSVSYVLTDEERPPVAVQFTFRYHVDESVSVSPPIWYTADEARRAG